jgi:hypothetical protein
MYLPAPKTAYRFVLMAVAAAFLACIYHLMLQGLQVTTTNECVQQHLIIVPAASSSQLSNSRT